MKIPGFENEPFELEEFVPPYIFKKYGKNSIWFIDMEVVASIVFLRKVVYAAPMTLNNWHTGGDYENRVFRLPNVVGSFLSQHKAKCATDYNVKGLNGMQSGKVIIDNWKGIHGHVCFTTIENPEFTRRKLPDGSWSIGWTHLDKRWTLDQSKLLIVNP